MVAGSGVAITCALVGAALLVLGVGAAGPLPLVGADCPVGGVLALASPSGSVTPGELLVVAAVLGVTEGDE